MLFFLSCAGSFVSAGSSSLHWKSFSTCCFAMAILCTTPLILHDFRTCSSLTNASNILFASVKAGSATIENCLECGGMQRYLSMATQIAFKEDGLYTIRSRFNRVVIGVTLNMFLGVKSQSEKISEM